MRTTLFIIIILGYLSCTSNSIENKYGEVEFSNIELVKSVPLNKIEYSYLIEAIGKYLIVLNFRTGDVVAVYDADDLKFLTSGISFGAGPEEIITPVSLHTNIVDKSFLIYDPSLKKALVYDLDKIVNANSFSPIESVKLPSTGENMFPIFKINEKTFLTMSYTQDSHFITFTSEGNILDRSGSFPQLNNEQDIFSRIVGLIWEGRYAYNKQKNLIVKGYLELDRLDIFNIKGDLIHSSSLTGNSIPQFNFDDKSGRVLKDSDRKICYISMKTTEDFIYGLYSGANLNNISDVLVGHEIHVFNFEGDLLTKLSLHIPISDFVVLENSNKIIGLNYTLDEGLIEYQF